MVTIRALLVTEDPPASIVVIVSIVSSVVNPFEEPVTVTCSVAVNVDPWPIGSGRTLR